MFSFNQWSLTWLLLALLADFAVPQSTVRGLRKLKVESQEAEEPAAATQASQLRELSQRRTLFLKGESLPLATADGDLVFPAEATKTKGPKCTSKGPKKSKGPKGKGKSKGPKRSKGPKKSKGPNKSKGPKETKAPKGCSV